MIIDDFDDIKRRLERRPERQQKKQGCTYCIAFCTSDIFPPHDPSPRCESGKRPHCSCDICF